MAQHGGKRPGAGRKPGQVSKAKIDIAERAKTHGDAALKTLAEIMASKDEPASARVAAANALLDRGYGKPAQAVALSNPDGSLAPKPIDASKLSTGALREIMGAMSATPEPDGG
jgi:hypothetical protein